MSVYDAPRSIQWIPGEIPTQFIGTEDLSVTIEHSLLNVIFPCCSDAPFELFPPLAPADFAQVQLTKTGKEALRVKIRSVMIFFKLPKPHSCSTSRPSDIYLFEFLIIVVELSGLLLFLQLVEEFSSFFRLVSFIQIVILSCAYCANAVYK